MDESIQKLEEIDRRLSKAFYEDREMVAQILDSLPDGLIIIDDKGTIQLVNHQVELLFGYQRTLLLGQNIRMLLPDNLRERHDTHIQTYFAGPSVRPMNLSRALPGLHRNGSTTMVQITLGPVVSVQGVLALAIVRRVVNG